MLRLNNVQVIYSDVILVLKGLSLEVTEGQIVALLGANGAGKTTTLKAISGLLKTEDGRVTDGSIEFLGRRVDGLDPEDICRRGIVQVMEGRKVLETLTVEENLRIGGYTRRDADGIQQDLRMIYEYFPILVTRRHQVAGYLSGGEQQMLVIGRALMARPKLLLLDEPSLGLAPLLVREIFDIIRKIHEERGTTFLLVEQNAQMALRIADYGYIMQNGRIVFDAHEIVALASHETVVLPLPVGDLSADASQRPARLFLDLSRQVFFERLAGLDVAADDIPDPRYHSTCGRPPLDKDAAA